MEIDLSQRLTPGSTLTHGPNGWRLEIPEGAKKTYRLAQLDDYSNRARRDLRWKPPLSATLRARVSARDLPGTWGFGFWNDPFGLSLGFGGTPGRLPALPETTWFFHASPPNFLALNDALPAQGFFAGAIHSTSPGWFALAGLPALPLLAIRRTSRLLRRFANRFIHEEAVSIAADVTRWHEYTIQWLRDGSVFLMDGQTILRSSCSPSPPLGLVLWIDNQYAGWSPRGEIRFGTLNNPAAWLEVADLQIRPG